MASPKISLTKYCTTKTRAALFVEKKLNSLKETSLWTMTITPEKYGGYSVTTVIGGSSDGIAGNSAVGVYYDELLNT